MTGACTFSCQSLRFSNTKRLSTEHWTFLRKCSFDVLVYIQVRQVMCSYGVLVRIQVRPVTRLWDCEAIISSDVSVTSRCPVIPAAWRHWSWHAASRPCRTAVPTTVTSSPAPTSVMTSRHTRAAASTITSLVLCPATARLVSAVETRISVVIVTESSTVEILK